MIVAVTAVLAVLVVAGAWQLVAARSNPNEYTDGALAPDPADGQGPARLLADQGERANVVVAALEVVGILAATWTTVRVVGAPGVATTTRVVVVAALVVGTPLVGRALSVRLGFAGRTDGFFGSNNDEINNEAIADG